MRYGGFRHNEANGPFDDINLLEQLAQRLEQQERPQIRDVEQPDLGDLGDVD
jgi:hypothetical protein